MNKNEETLRTYERIAHQYAERNAQNEFVNSQRQRFASFLNGDVVYDFGCGTGRDAAAFQEMGYKVIGFDGSSAMLKEARRLHPHTEFNQLDMLSNDWEVGTQANGIWACASLLHFDQADFVVVFEKLVNLLEVNGVLYFSVKTHPSLTAEAADGRFFQYYTKEWLDDHLKKNNCLDQLFFEENNAPNGHFISYFLRKTAE